MYRYLRNRVLRQYYRVKKFARARPIIFTVSTVGIVSTLYLFIFAAPLSFPTGAYVNIPSGSSLTASAEILKERNVIRSTFIFKVFAYLTSGDRHVVAGEYLFPTRANVVTIAMRLGSGDFKIDPVKIRVQEGFTVNEITALLVESLPDFNVVGFKQATRGKEGYLFPDTYFFMPGQEAGSILGVFDNNFNKNIAKIQTQIDAFGQPLSDVIVMASLLEREAPSSDDRRIIAGILWKRIKIGMPLQVDAVFPYIIGKNTYQLTKADLKIDSPYNTYTNKGLPPGPIANPGLNAILAAVTPIKTSYLYYLSDRNGNFHYSATYEQHLAAKNKYVKN